VLSDIEALENNQVYILLRKEQEINKQNLTDAIIESAPTDIATFVVREQSIGMAKAQKEFLQWVKLLKEEAKQTIQQRNKKDENKLVAE